MNILFNLKSGVKFQLTSEVRLKRKKYINLNKSETVYKILPENLVLSLVSLHASVYGTRAIFKVIRAKPVIEKYYQNILEDTYLSRWGIKKQCVSSLSIKIHNIDELDAIIESCKSFNDEYKVLTQSLKS